MVKKELESKRHTAQKQNICMKLNLKYQCTYVHIRENLIQYIIKFLPSKLTPRSDHPQLVNEYRYEVMPYGHLYAPTLDTKNCHHFRNNLDKHEVKMHRRYDNLTIIIHHLIVHDSVQDISLSVP